MLISLRLLHLPFLMNIIEVRKQIIFYLTSLIKSMLTQICPTTVCHTKLVVSKFHINFSQIELIDIHLIGWSLLKGGLIMYNKWWMGRIKCARRGFKNAKDSV